MKEATILRNTHSDFVGLSALRQKHSEQLALFEIWAANHDWISFHTAHYDWWMFPIDQASRLGFAFTIYRDEVELLKTDSAFVTNYLRGVELLLLSWGWNLEKKEMIQHPDKDQNWHNWPIRLYKCAQSLALFGFEREYFSVIEYGHLLLEQGEDFMFRGKDLSVLFTKKDR